MFIHGIEGSWLSHPFWRRRFLLRSDSDIAALRDADIAFVTIDTARGLAPIEEPEPQGQRTMVRCDRLRRSPGPPCRRGRSRAPTPRR